MLKKGDFVEIDYTGRMLPELKAFDTTIKEVAVKEGIEHTHEEGEAHNHTHEHTYSSIEICIGERHILPGLDAKLEGKELGKHKITLKEEEAFGKKSAKNLKMMPMALFKKQQIQPFVGLELNIDGQLGIIRSVSGGRVIVDFNHPLAGKDIEYEVDIKRIISDGKEKVEAMLKMAGMPAKKIDVKDGKAEIETDARVPQELTALFAQDIEKLTGLKVEFKTVSPENEKKKGQEPKKNGAKKDDTQK